jgi:hypothetical protein
MRVLLYKRHKPDCAHADDKPYRRCNCSVWLEWNDKGKQTRKSAKTRSWAFAEEKARAVERTYLDAELGRGPAPAEAKTVEQAIALFLDSKRGEDLSPNTLYKHRHTLGRLQTFCDTAGIFFVKDITLSHLTSWRATWPFESPLVKRSWQERVKAFFKFCTAAGLTPVNPTQQLAPIQVKADEANPAIRPLEPDEYKAIIATVDQVGLLPEVAARVKACMQLQRWSGLSLIDAVWLTKDELIQDGKMFRSASVMAGTGTTSRATSQPLFTRVRAGSRTCFC